MKSRARAVIAACFLCIHGIIIAAATLPHAKEKDGAVKAVIKICYEPMPISLDLIGIFFRAQQL